MCELLIPGQYDEAFTLLPAHESQAPPFPVPSTVRTVLSRNVDLHGIPKRTLLKALAAHTLCPPEKATLLEMAKEYNPAELTNVVDLLDQFRSCRPPIGTALQLLPAIMPRSYTVSSSPLQAPDCVHVTYNLQTFTQNSEVLHGLCTGYLATLPHIAAVRAQLTPSSFQSFVRLLPDLDSPAILVGTGTGLAPMRAVLQHKRAQSRDLSRFQLFFGCCHPERDFIYEDELREMEKEGLVLDVAFSRLCESKIYVQDLIRERAASVYERLHDKGGYLLVCGGTAMGSAVQAVIVDCGVNCGGMSREESKGWVDSLLETGHYVQELWS